MSDPEVIAVNRLGGMALLSDNQIIPITDWFCAITTGGITEDMPCDPEAATACVAGPDADGKWYGIDLSAFDEATTQ